MRFLIDTPLLIDHLRGDPRAFDALIHPAMRGHELWSSTLARAEVLSAMPHDEEGDTKALLSEIRWLTVTRRVADRAAWMARQDPGRHLGQDGGGRRAGVSIVDYILAASTDALGARLVTSTPERYPTLAGLPSAYR